MKTLLTIVLLGFFCLLTGCEERNCPQVKRYEEVVLRGVILDYERVADRNARFGVHTELKFQNEDSSVIDLIFTGLVGILAKGVPVELSYLDDLRSDCDSFRSLRLTGPDSVNVKVYPDSVVVFGTILGINEYIHEAGGHSTVTHTTIMYNPSYAGTVLSVVVYWDRERDIRHLITRISLGEKLLSLQ